MNERLINEELKDIIPFKDKHGQWFLKLVYNYTDIDGVHERIYPKVELPIPSNKLCNVRFMTDGLEDLCINCTNCMRLFKDDIIDSECIYLNINVLDSIIEPAETKEMTLDEVEKKTRV